MTDHRGHADEGARLAAAFAGLPDATIAADLENRLWLVNPAAEALFGVRESEILGQKSIDTLVEPAARAATRESCRRVTAGEVDRVTLPIRLLRSDGSGFRAEVVISPIRGADGDILGTVGVVRDVTERLATEADVATLRAIVDAAEEAIVGVDRQGDILFFSPSAERLYGWRADEVIGRPVSVLVADHEQHLMPDVRDALIAGQTVRREGVARRRDGSHVEAELNASPIMGPDGKMQGTALIVLDISARRRAQRMLERFVEHAPNVLAVKDISGRYLMFSTLGAQAVRRTPEEIIGSTDRDIWGDEFGEQLEQQDRAVLEAGAPLTFENTWRGSSGGNWTFVTTKFPIPGPGGDPEALGVIAAEVTEMRRAETDRMQLAALVQAAPDAIIARDREDRIATWNPGAEQMFGLAAKDAIGRSYVELTVPEGERERVHEIIERVNAGETLSGRSNRIRADGSVFPAQISVAPLTLLDGSWHGALAMIRDITDLVEAEEELRERAALLERSNADLERFAYAASHDLQEPLNSIRLSAGAVIEAARERLDPDERELMEHIDAAASRLSGQVRGLMEVAQVALGRESGEQVTLEVAIRDAIDALRAAAVECGAAIEVQEPVPAVDVPRTELSAVLQNVISNAIKYRRDGVTPRIVIAAEKGETIIEVRVADNGVGLSDEELDRIFGLFERGVSDQPGTGMGLAVARRMLERLGGTILARSPGRGEGSEFTVLVPLSGG
ncbi:PAS domain S-box protein [Solirubrobacter ginsenosidimutans]|uniref:histidine kinase n=1 Tax=Solirubrobacter ginsenosidimutans TaxID=490573 RepID=A0A9X3MWC5_9ACTN|nr:PAS domain S-box protein [Solirubrobacter ginsenosidimutans]MDA0160973.1 PAS domain S-box protein [Solirubrobacter ginsenosidimutans]